MITLGSIVKYAPQWCREEERDFRHVVLENLLNPVTDEMTRWKISNQNATYLFGTHPVEVVDECMIEPSEISYGGFSLMWYLIHDGVAQSVIRTDDTGKMFFMETSDMHMDAPSYIRWFVDEDDGDSGFSCGDFDSVEETLSEMGILKEVEAC